MMIIPIILPDNLLWNMIGTKRLSLRRFNASMNQKAYTFLRQHFMLLNTINVW